MASYTKSPDVFENPENKESAENAIKNARLMMAVRLTIVKYKPTCQLHPVQASDKLLKQ